MVSSAFIEIGDGKRKGEGVLEASEPGREALGFGLVTSVQV